MTEKTQNITISRRSTTTRPIGALWRILPPPGQSGSPIPGGVCYHPVKTSTLPELTFTPDTFFYPEESIGNMPLSPSGCGMDNNLTINGLNEVNARSCGCFHLLALSARRRRMMILDNCLRLGHQWQEEGIELWCLCKIGFHRCRRCHCRGRVLKQASNWGVIWQQYDHSEK